MKKVEIVIIKISREGILRQKVLKALENPPRIFYVPYNLALMNFVFWFLIFVISMVVFLIIPPHTDMPMWLPLSFLTVLSLSHAVLGIYSRQDSQIAQVILSRLNIIKRKIPRRLVI